MIFLRHHIHEALKSKYVVVDEPLVLWKALGERYDHERMMTLPRARYEWTHLRFQDFKSVSEYNSAMHRITSLMRLYGSECHFISWQYPQTWVRGQVWPLARKHKRSWCSTGLGPRSSASTNGKNASRNKGKAQTSHMPRNVESTCHRCGAKGHWVRAFHTPKHLTDLYQPSLKNRKVEINYIDHAPPATYGSSEISRQLNKTHLDVSDFVTKRGNEAYGSELD
ncbi:hypothetical protein L3X38_032783 [Prunus dulcis]|uniref:Uncharacterized protein n=1 Tax=Prunus dulcis TaxID=3755 RepID=A0AAD4VFV0_PRUDU|nr:hypothetical protein L3X38_032783 [Prunus dulcis]